MGADHGEVHAAAAALEDLATAVDDEVVADVVVAAGEVFLLDGAHPGLRLAARDRVVLVDAGVVDDGGLDLLAVPGRAVVVRGGTPLGLGDDRRLDDGRGAGAGTVGDGEAVAVSLEVVLGEAVSVGDAESLGGGVAVSVSVGVGVAVSVGVSVGAGVMSCAYATGFAALFGSVPGSRSFTSMPDGRAVAEPSAATTRTSTPSDGPVHTEAVPPRVAASAASLPSAEKGSSGRACQPDHSPVPASFDRIWAVPLSFTSGSDQVSSAALNCAVSCFGSPLRPAPWPASLTVRTAAARPL